LSFVRGKKAPSLSRTELVQFDRLSGLTAEEFIALGPSRFLRFFRVLPCALALAAGWRKRSRLIGDASAAALLP
jgi:hypothetical protein